MDIVYQLKSFYNRPFKDSHSQPIHTCFPIIASNESKKSLAVSYSKHGTWSKLVPRSLILLLSPVNNGVINQNGSTCGNHWLPADVNSFGCRRSWLRRWTLESPWLSWVHTYTLKVLSIFTACQWNGEGNVFSRVCPSPPPNLYRASAPAFPLPTSDMFKLEPHCTGPCPPPPTPGHIQTCSLWRSYCRNVDGWHWTEMPSWLFYYQSMGTIFAKSMSLV